MIQVSISTPGITVSLGYVTVDGFWKDLRIKPTPWRSSKALLHTAWKPDAQPLKVEWK